MRKFSVLQRSRKVLGAALVSGLLGVCGVGPAQAVIFQGAWDPAFGDAFPDLGWRGEAEFFVPNTCVRGTGWRLNIGSCSGMKILSAEVEFYNLDDPTNTDLQETLLFNIASSAVLKMEFDDGLLAGLYGTFLYSRESTLPFAGGPYTDFTLFFQGDFARMFYVSYPPDGPKTHGVSDVNLNDPPSITFRLVPEPGSLALVFAGLSALGFWARRRKVA